MNPVACQTDSDQPVHCSMQAAKTLTKQCQYLGLSEYRLFVHASVNSCQSSKLGYLPTQNTDQTIIKRRCDAGYSYHFTLNLFLSSADKLYKKNDQEKGLTVYWA